MAKPYLRVALVRLSAIWQMSKMELSGISTAASRDVETGDNHGRVRDPRNAWSQNSSFHSYADYALCVPFQGAPTPAATDSGDGLLIYPPET
ncbi:hypothetical protein [Pontibaca salina]|uniref:Uncharacterized protein n=1 Tax=Pontibaca salina TaxID=2795731 RepID=A0A934HSB3_9RHOB|nr:hypothetical protein [Pontibaca salina]MBI6630517.1 hypothetical protein [Pontibaca salina]